MTQRVLKKKTAKAADYGERVMGFEPTNGSLGSYCLTTWLHPRDVKLILLDGEKFDNPDPIL